MSKSRYESVIFYSAIGVSIAIHVWILALWIVARLPQNDASRSSNQANITYFSESPHIESAVIDERGDSDRAWDVRTVSSQSASDRDSADKFLMHGVEPQSSSHEPDFLQSAAISSDKAQKVFQEESVTEKRSPKVSLEKISIPTLASGSIRPDNYPDYFNRIGEKIRKKAYEMVKRRRDLLGEVRVSFILNPDGGVHDIRVFDQRRASDRYLQDVVADIVRAASPFESFPPQMGDKDLSCEVAIEFR